MAKTVADLMWSFLKLGERAFERGLPLEDAEAEVCRGYNELPEEGDEDFPLDWALLALRVGYEKAAEG